MVVESSRITADQLRRKLLSRQPVQSVDFRTAEEFKRGHVAGSINVPLDDLQSGRAKVNFNPAECVYLICTDASKADIAAMVLRDLGFDDVLVLAGGLKSWSALGFELEKGDERKLS